MPGSKRQKSLDKALVVIDRDDEFPPGGVNGFSVCTWNMLAPCLHEAHPGCLLWIQRRSAWQRCLQRLSKCDVLCFQEVDRDSVAAELNDMLEAEGFAAVHQDLKGRAWGNATFFKAGRLRLVWSEHRSRVLLTGFALPNGCVIGVVNVHLEAGDAKINEAQRISMLTSAVRHLHKYSPSYIVVAGDFNSSLKHDSKLREMLVAQNLHRVPIQGLTFAVPGYADTLDHIWASEALRPRALQGSTPQALKQIAGEGLPNFDHASDHLPVAAKFLVQDCVKGPQMCALNAPPVDCDSTVRSEWLQILAYEREAMMQGESQKKAKRTQRELEKAFFQAISEEAAAYLRQWHSAAAAVAKAAVAASVLHAQAHVHEKRMLQARVAKQDTHVAKDQCKHDSNKQWDPGGFAWNILVTSLLAFTHLELATELALHASAETKAERWIPRASAAVSSSMS
jgi:endonuclease/exonuclease/phosphatase family metal-dependent hydrolase